jgi:hypothetical protein
MDVLEQLDSEMEARGYSTDGDKLSWCRRYVTPRGDMVVRPNPRLDGEVYVSATMRPDMVADALMGPDKDKLFIDGFINQSVYRESMLERDKLIESLAKVVNGFMVVLDAGATSEGINADECADMRKEYAQRMAELGF